MAGFGAGVHISDIEQVLAEETGLVLDWTSGNKDNSVLDGTSSNEEKSLLCETTRGRNQEGEAVPSLPCRPATPLLPALTGTGFPPW